MRSLAARITRLERERAGRERRPVFVYADHPVDDLDAELARFYAAGGKPDEQGVVYLIKHPRPMTTEEWLQRFGPAARGDAPP